MDVDERTCRSWDWHLPRRWPTPAARLICCQRVAMGFAWTRAAIPEPPTLLLLAFGAGTILLHRHRG